MCTNKGGLWGFLESVDHLVTTTGQWRENYACRIGSPMAGDVDSPRKPYRYSSFEFRNYELQFRSSTHRQLKYIR